MSPELNPHMVEEFVFVDGGRTFTCAAESQPSRPDAWWWFRVSSEERSRYAPFRAEASDTPETVQPRIVRFYDELLERRAAPPRPYWRRGSQPGAAAAAPADAPSAAQQAEKSG